MQACARRVTGTKLSGLPPLTDRQSDCSSFMTVTETGEATTTTTTVSSTVTVLRRQESSAPSDIPSYAAEFCNASLYSAICSSWGITPAVTTVTPTSTVTVTPTVTSISGVLQVMAEGGVSLGYIAPDPNYWTPLLTPDVTAALGITFLLPGGATQATGVDFAMSNDARGTYFAPVLGRDSVGDDIAPGSFK